MRRYGKLNKSDKDGVNVIEFSNNFEQVGQYEIHPDYAYFGEHWDSVDFELVDEMARILKVTPRNDYETKPLTLSASPTGEIREHSLYVTSQKYKELLVIQSKPEPKIFFKGIEVTPEKLIEILENADLN